MTISRNDIRMALARGYCTPANERKTLDVVLIEAMADEVMQTIDIRLREQLEQTKKEQR